ncbi:MAG: hypothetical protein M0C28_08700 [Candidatus Moduliflexus flocculans]|nr:hypothetical protein [Candidatus Moduliflexus flocculans]
MRRRHLRQTLDELEQRVAERTIELTEANEKLRREIEERKLAEKNLRQKEREIKLNCPAPGRDKHCAEGSARTTGKG